MTRNELLHVKDVLQRFAPTEEEEQRTLFRIIRELEFIWPHLDLVFHIPNSGAGPSRGMAGRMKAMGAKRGVADVFWPIAKKPYHGLWIELKSLRIDSRLTRAQKNWLTRMRLEGYRAEVCYGHIQALETLIEYDTGAKIKGDMIVRLPVYCSIYGHKFADKMIKMHQVKPNENKIAPKS